MSIPTLIDIDYSSRISALRSVGQAIGVPSNLLPDKNASISNIECLRWINIIRQAKSFPLLPGLDYNGFVGAINDIVTLAGGGSTEMGRPLITADTTYYVTVDGNDTSGDGSQTKPWLTIKAAFNYLQSIDFNGHALILNIGPGTFVGAILNGAFGGGSLKITGDSTTTTILTDSGDTNYTALGINSTGSTAITIQNMTIAPLVFGIAVNYANVFIGSLILSTNGMYYYMFYFNMSTVYTEGNIEVKQFGGSYYSVISIVQTQLFDGGVWTFTGSADTVQSFLTATNNSYYECSQASYDGTLPIGSKFGLLVASQIYTNRYNFNKLPGTLPGTWDPSSFYDRLPGAINSDNGVGATAGGSFPPVLGHARYVLNKINGYGSDYIGATNGVNRWLGTFGNATPETGANAGSDLDLTPYDDTGVALPVALRIARATGVVNFAVHPTVAGVPLLAELTDTINKLSAKVAALEAKGKK